MFAWDVPQSLVMVAQYKNISLSPKTLKPTFHIIYLTMNEMLKWKKTKKMDTISYNEVFLLYGRQIMIRVVLITLYS